VGTNAVGSISVLTLEFRKDDVDPDFLSHGIVLPSPSIMKMEAIHPSRMLKTIYKTTWRHSPENHNRRLHRRENPRSRRECHSHCLLRLISSTIACLLTLRLFISDICCPDDGEIGTY
jgi:hypothetical protein